MRLQFTTSIASDRFSFMDGQVIEVDHLTAQFAAWRDRGIVTILESSERAEAVPAMEVADVPFGRSRRSGRGRRRSVSAPVPA